MTDLPIRSDIPGAEWPPVSNQQNAVLLALLRQFEQAQWLPRAAIEAGQFRQLEKLATHCAAHSPLFARRLNAAELTPVSLASADGLARLPVMTRRDLQSGADVYCTRVPPGHSPVETGTTSGSTGEPVTVRRTAINNFDWFALTMREHLWHRRDLTARFCAVRANFTEVIRAEHWGRPFNAVTHTGPFLGLPITTDIDVQIDLIAEFAPQILLVYPSNLDAILRRCTVRGIALPSIRHVQTVGETLSPELRKVREALGWTVTDIYSANEVGYLACQCPDSGLYHTMETLLVEVLRDDGSPCLMGETGRVVVTDLRNFATPLIRYDIGDYAEAGPVCACGRGLRTLARVVGRERNLIAMPDGTRHWPLVGFAGYRAIAPVVQYQLIQTDRENIEVRLVVERALTAAEEAALTAHIQKSLGHAFAVRFVYFDGKLPTGANGKFEDFISRVS